MVDKIKITNIPIEIDRKNHHFSIDYSVHKYALENLVVFNELKNLVEQHPFSYFKLIKHPENAHLLNYIYNNTLHLDSSYNMQFRIAWIIYGLSDFPHCQGPDCNNLTKFCGVFYGFNCYCCNSCAQKSETTKANRATTFYNMYGISVDNCQHVLEIHEKTVETLCANYGVTVPCKSPEIMQHMRDTNNDRYGKDYYVETDEFLEKTISSKIERYGDVNYNNREKALSTNMVLYGKEQVNLFGSDEFLNTMESKYGEKYSILVPEIRAKMKKRYCYKDINFDSQPELAYYIWLKDNDVDFEYQPSSEFTYIVAGKVRKYFPDFKIGNTYVEIKGDQFLKEDGTWQCPWNHTYDNAYEAKRQCLVENNVKILYSKDYQQYLDYIALKYGKDYLQQFRKHTTISKEATKTEEPETPSFGLQ